MAAVDLPVAYTEYGANEAHMKAVLRKKQLPNELVLDHDFQCAVIPHGVDNTLFHTVSQDDREKFRARMNDEPDSFIMLNVNSHQHRKDVLRSLEIHKELLRRGVKSRLIMHMPENSFGSGNPGGTSLEYMGWQLGLELGKDWAHSGDKFKHSNAFGSVKEEDLHQYYAAADLYLSTTLGEGWGLGAVEAIACGTPAAVPDNTACAELASKLADQTLLLPVEPGYVANHLDNSRLRRRVDLQGAADVIEKFAKAPRRVRLSKMELEWLNWNRIADEWLNAYKAEPKRRAPAEPEQEFEGLKVAS